MKTITFEQWDQKLAGVRDRYTTVDITVEHNHHELRVRTDNACGTVSLTNDPNNHQQLVPEVRVTRGTALGGELSEVRQGIRDYQAVHDFLLHAMMELEFERVVL